MHDAPPPPSSDPERAPVARSSMLGLGIAGAAHASAAVPASDAVPGYRIEGRLGAGGMGAVFDAVELTSGRRVAIKVLHEHLAGTGAEQRFAREIERLGALRHPAVARIHTGGVLADGRPYHVMERIDGEPITARARRERWDPDACVRCVLAVTDGLAAVHAAGLLHRDLKPGNLLVDREGAPRILDLGLSLAMDARIARQTLDGASVGTVHTMSPEQLQGRRDLDARTDVYSLALVLLEMVRGELPWAKAAKAANAARAGTAGFAVRAARLADGSEAETSRWVRGLPRNLAAVLARALAWDRDRRTPNVAEFAQDLQRVLMRLPVARARLGVLARTRLLVARQGAVLGLLGAAACVLVSSLSFALVQLDAARRDERAAAAIHAGTVHTCRELLPLVALVTDAGGGGPAAGGIAAAAASESERILELRATLEAFLVDDGPDSSSRSR